MATQAPATVPAAAGAPAVYVVAAPVEPARKPVESGQAPGGRVGSAFAGFIALVACILLGIGAGGPWWQKIESTSEYLWLCLSGFRFCLGGADCSTQTDLTLYQTMVGVLNLVVSTGNINIIINQPSILTIVGTPAFQALTSTVFNTMKAGAAFLAIGCILAAFAMIFSFVAACAGNTSCMRGAQAFFHTLTFICALIGAACGTSGVVAAKWNTTLNGFGMSYGFGLGCAWAGVIVSVIGTVLVAMSNGCSRKA